MLYGILYVRRLDDRQNRAQPSCRLLGAFVPEESEYGAGDRRLHFIVHH